MHRFPFEDITLILHRFCNLQCTYCPLQHTNAQMDVGLIESILQYTLLTYINQAYYITLFGGEPLLNIEGVKYIVSWIQENQEKIRASGNFYTFKLVTNGTLLSKDLIALLEGLCISGVSELQMNISIDGGEITQKIQRPARIGDYSYEKLIANIYTVSESNIHFEIGLVMGIYNEHIIQDIMELWELFHRPIFIMPVDLNFDFLSMHMKNRTIYTDYIRRIHEVMLYFRNHPLSKEVLLNFKDKDRGFRDLKLPPIGPTFDTNGDIYLTRDFLFQMDRESIFVPLGNIYFGYTFSEAFSYFNSENIFPLTQLGLHLYYGRTIGMNKFIGDIFTKALYAA